MWVKEKFESDQRIVERIDKDISELTPEIKERLKVLENFENVSANIRATTLVRFKDYRGVSSSEKVGELIQQEVKKLERYNEPGKQIEIGTIGEFRCVIATRKGTFGDALLSLLTKDPGNIFYEHNYGTIPTDKMLTTLSFERALLNISKLRNRHLKYMDSSEKQMEALSVTIQRTWGKENTLADLKAQRVELEKKISNLITDVSQDMADEIEEAKEMNDEEFDLYQLKMQTKAELKLIGLDETDINDILEGSEVTLQNITLTNPYVENEQISCSSAHISFDTKELLINDKSVKEYFEHTLGLAQLQPGGYKR